MVDLFDNVCFDVLMVNHFVLLNVHALSFLT